MKPLRLKSIFVFCAALLLGMATAYAEDPKIEFEARSWDPDFSSKAKIIKNNIGTTVDFTDDLGLSDEDSLEGTLTMYSSNGKVRASYLTFEYDNQQPITRTFSFQGNTYTVGTTVNTDLEVAYGRLGWIFFLTSDKAPVRVGGIVELKYIAFDIDIQVPALTTLNQSEDVAGALPTVGVAAEIRPMDNLIIYAEIAGIEHDDYGHFYEAEAGVKFRPVDYISLTAGYRVIEMKLEDDKNSFTLKLDGFFLGGGVQF
jgi:hypothetical protein